MTKKLICVGGARPNFMKLAPLVRQLELHERFEPVLVHTGQHYDDKMSGSFFRDLGMPNPGHFLNVGSGTHAVQTAEVMKRFEPVCEAERPDGVVVVGDVNSTVAAALVASKLGIAVVHVEAGLRSFDRTMPEEINRLVTDAVSDLLLVTEESGRLNLLNVGVPESRITVVGNLMIDTLMANLERARSLPPVADVTGPFAVVTLHRPANVDAPEQLNAILEALDDVARTMPVYFPVHPRTRANLPANLSPAFRLLEPLGYLEFLGLTSRASIVLTDSGGIQEETTALGIPCLTLRDNTERPITIEQGTNRLAGTSTASIRAAWQEHVRQPKSGRIPPFWDGHAAVRCAAALEKFFFPA